jgi:DNA-cytosine methyltransferase
MAGQRGATLFSGGGGVEALLKDRIEFVHAVEYDAQIAAVYAKNIGAHVQVADVREVDYSAWGALDYLHASPVCKNASQAKTDGEESDTDVETAMAVVRALEATNPTVFTLENVWGYRTFKAFRLICQALERGGYMWHFEHLNSADFGVPQTRRRLILRASRGLLPSLPNAERWVGWYEAIEDLIPGLPESAFAPWQLERLPAGLLETAIVEGTEMRGDNGRDVAAHPVCTVKATTYKGMSRAFIVDGQTNDAGRRLTVPHSEAPMYTVSASMEKRPARAWLVNEDSKMGIVAADAPAPTQVSSARARKARALLVHANDMRSMPTRYEDEPAFTITAASHSSHMPDTKPRAWLSAGRVVKMTPRALARFQSLPDSYELPNKASLACTVIGNMAPPLMMRKIVEQML